MNRDDLEECVKWGPLLKLAIPVVIALIAAMQIMITEQVPNAVSRQEYLQVQQFLVDRLDRIEEKIDTQMANRARSDP